MSDIENQTPVDDGDVDLDTFASELFGQSKPADEPASSEGEEVDETVEVDATETDTHDEDDALAPEDEDEDETPVEEVKPKKNRLQERIDGLIKDREDEKRLRVALEARLAALEKPEATPEPKPAPTQATNTGPNPDDTNEDGSEKYPLGEFDPNYIRDLTKHALKEEREAEKARDAERVEQEEMDAQRAELQRDWQTKLTPAKERYPDFTEKGEQLFESFSTIEPAYGEYLVATIMGMDNGPDVLYYLANNVDEAEAIIAKGPTKATIALGRIETKFAELAEDKQPVRSKVTKAPPPPAHLNKGSAIASSSVSDDTDDLDAFAAKLFKKRR